MITGVFVRVKCVVGVDVTGCFERVDAVLVALNVGLFAGVGLVTMLLIVCNCTVGESPFANMGASVAA